MQTPHAAFLLAGACGLCGVLMSLAGCHEATAPDVLSVDSTLVSSAGVDPPADRTYEFDRSTVNPDSALRALWTAGLEVTEAWRPVDYACLDPRGGRLTVELAAPDVRMSAHGYSPGTGRLACATTLVRYVVVPRR